MDWIFIFTICAVTLLQTSLFIYWIRNNKKDSGRSHWPYSVMITTLGICVCNVLTFCASLFFDNNASNHANFQIANTKLVAGKIAYSIPDTMELGENYKATVSIAQSLNDSILLKSLDSNIVFKIEHIYASDVVKAHLVDPTNERFSIVPLSTEEQVLSDRTNSIWNWNIRALKDGENEISIRVTIKYKGELQSGYKDIPIFTKSIFVKSSAAYVAKNVFYNYWQWFISVLILPPLIWAIRILFMSFQKKNNGKVVVRGFRKKLTCFYNNIYPLCGAR